MNWQKKVGKISLISFGVFALLMIALSPNYESTKTKQSTPQKISNDQKIKSKEEFQKKFNEYEILARACSMETIEESIAPRPADFPLKRATYDETKNLFRISSYVDTVNDYGVPLRKRYYCEISEIDLDLSICKKANCQWES